MVLFKLVLFMLASFIIRESHESATVGFAGGFFQILRAKKAAVSELKAVYFFRASEV